MSMARLKAAREASEKSMGTRTRSAWGSRTGTAVGRGSGWVVIPQPPGTLCTGWVGCVSGEDHIPPDRKNPLGMGSRWRESALLLERFLFALQRFFRRECDACFVWSAWQGV